MWWGAMVTQTILKPFIELVSSLTLATAAQQHKGELLWTQMAGLDLGCPH